MTTKTTGSFNNNTTPPVDAQYLNIQRDEMNALCVIDGTTLDSSGIDNSQQAQAVKAYVSQAGILCTDSGSSANSYILTASSPFTNPPLKTGTRVRFKTANANTGSSTITPFGASSAIICTKSDGSTALTTGDIPANTEVEFVYNGTNFVQGMNGNANLNALANLNGSANKIPYFTGAGAMAVRDLFATTTTQGVTFLSNPVQVVNDGSNPNDTVGFVAGTFITSAGNQIYLPTITKKIQSSGAFTAGSGNNGLDTGARTASTFYRTFVIQNNSTLAYDILFSVSATSPTVPSGYTNLGIIDYAMIRVNGSTNIASSKWDARNKELVLGPGQSIQVVSSTAGSGNTLILNTTEPLKFSVRGLLSLTTAGASDFYIYGSESSASDGNDGGVLIATNNGFIATGGGLVDTSDGKVYWKNFSTAGGVANQIFKIKSIKIRS